MDSNHRSRLKVLTVSGSSLVVSGDLSTLSSRKRSSQRTQRWRKPDSNHRSRVTRPSFSMPARSCHLCLVPRTRRVGANENRHHEDAGASRGTDGSNPVPSRGESVSLPELLSRVENPGFPRGCAPLAWRPGPPRRAGCFKIAPTGGNISVAPYSSTAVPPIGVGENTTPIPIMSGRSPSLIVRWSSALGPGSTKAQHDPLIVPGKWQA